MRVDLYTRCWNDGDMLGFFFRHYDALVRRYIVYDDGSTDSSLEQLRAHPKVEVRAMPPYSDADSRIVSDLAVLDSCWKESRGISDWVIVTDIDEHLHHHRLTDYLARCKRSGITAIPALGYQMIASEFPSGDAYLARDITLGAPSFYMNKMSIFSPDDVEDANFAPGRHSAAPVGNIVMPSREEILLLHYKYLDLERTQRRNMDIGTRQRKKDLENNWGFPYSWSIEQLRHDWEQIAARLVDTSDSNLRPWESHKEARWWSSYQRAAVEDARGLAEQA